MDGKLISQLNEQLEEVKGNELLLVEDEGKSKKMPISLLATAGASGVNVGDIVLPGKLTMTLEQYKKSGRVDAIGVVFDKYKGLFVRNTTITAALATHETTSANTGRSGVGVFYQEVDSYNFTNGREILLQCKAISDGDKFAAGFPAFYKALQISQDCYLPSFEELRLILERVSEELKFIGLSWEPSFISSCTWDGLETTSNISVFYSDRFSFYDKKGVDETNSQFFVIDFL